MRIGLLLQVHRNADHDRPAFQCREMEGFAHIFQGAIHGFDRDMMRARRLRERRHINLLDVIGCGNGRIARKHHHRRIGARGNGKPGHDLRKARTTGGGSNADLAGGARIGISHRNSAMFMPGVDDVHPRLALHRLSPIHIRITHQGEKRIAAFLREDGCQNV